MAGEEDFHVLKKVVADTRRVLGGFLFASIPCLGPAQLHS
jgi:hypothetical protein